MRVESGFQPLGHGLTIRKMAPTRRKQTTSRALLEIDTPKSTLDSHGHLWPDADESSRSAIGAVIAGRMDSLGVAA
jgi:hypothetical protein